MNLNPDYVGHGGGMYCLQMAGDTCPGPGTHSKRNCTQQVSYFNLLNTNIRRSTARKRHQPATSSPDSGLDTTANTPHSKRARSLTMSPPSEVTREGPDTAAAAAARAAALRAETEGGVDFIEDSDEA